MSRPDGEPAFPWQYVDDGQPAEIHFGMTLRDYFAAKAMAGYLTGHAIHSQQYADWARNPPHCEEVASRAYAYADAMLQERQK